MKDSRYILIDKVIPWDEIEKALAINKSCPLRPEYTGEENKPSYPCGQTGGPIEYRIYMRYTSQGGHSIHIVKHSDGMCISPSLNILADKAFAFYTYLTLKELIKVSEQ